MWTTNPCPGCWPRSTARPVRMSPRWTRRPGRPIQARPWPRSRHATESAARPDDVLARVLRGSEPERYDTLVQSLNRRRRVRGDVEDAVPDRRLAARAPAGVRGRAGGHGGRSGGAPQRARSSAPAARPRRRRGGGSRCSRRSIDRRARPRSRTPRSADLPHECWNDGIAMPSRADSRLHLVATAPRILKAAPPGSRIRAISARPFGETS